MKNSRLALNVSKTQYMIFNTTSNMVLKIEYDNFGLQKADNFKYLGVTLDVKLNFKNHIDLLKSKLSSVAGVFGEFLITSENQQRECSILHFSAVFWNME